MRSDDLVRIRHMLDSSREAQAFASESSREGLQTDRKLALALTVANQAYYGPGYGPFTFVELTADAPAFAAGGSLRLALEVRNSGKECLRGCYSIDDKPWITTAWFDPTEAGIDQQAPGKSNRNGPQAWSKDWGVRWRNATTFHLTAYHPKGRKAAITVAEARVTTDETVQRSRIVPIRHTIAVVI